MTGQNRNSLPLVSVIMAVLQSGNPGVSVKRNGSLHGCPLDFKREPQTATSSADRSPLPRYHETISSPFASSAIPGAWLCRGLNGKMNSEENEVLAVAPGNAASPRVPGEKTTSETSGPTGCDGSAATLEPLRQTTSSVNTGNHFSLRFCRSIVIVPQKLTQLKRHSKMMHRPSRAFPFAEILYRLECPGSSGFCSRSIQCGFVIPHT